jgi:hypothetical protein
LPFYDNEEGMALLHQLALRRGVKAAALLRMLVREEARRAGVLSSDGLGPAINGQAEYARERERLAQEGTPLPEWASAGRDRTPGTRSRAAVNGTPAPDGPPDRTEELFAAWAEEDETGDSGELARREAEWEALKAQLNENRVAAGEERLF